MKTSKRSVRHLLARLGAVSVLLGAAHATSFAAGAVLPLLQAGTIDGWIERSFAGNTEYRSVEVDGVHAVHARANASASGLYREQSVGLAKWPLLHWRWRVESTVAVADERQKSGDDFAARVYVVATHPLFFWKTRALCYVWSNTRKAGEDWPNPYTANVHMIALNGSGDGVGGWVEHRRDVAADFIRYFGEAPAEINAVALMTDTDQSGTRASAWYSRVQFEGR